MLQNQNKEDRTKIKTRTTGQKSIQGGQDKNQNKKDKTKLN